jgi:putative tricarboxylic transport membrane protein
MENGLELIAGGLALAFAPAGLLFSTIGVLLGMVFGAMPGLSALTALAVLLPLTYTMSTENAILLFIGVLVGSQFGNSIPSVLIRTPGTPAAAMTAIEGWPFQQRGEGARALGVALVASVWGQLFSFVLVALTLLPLAQFAIGFIHPEIFALAVFGLMAASGLMPGQPLKGLVATVFGLALSTVGPDPVDGAQRFTFGILELQAGLELIPVVLGLLVVSELLNQSADPDLHRRVKGQSLRGTRILPTMKETRYIARATWIGSSVGFIMGVIPGVGSSAGAFIAYQQAKIFAHDPKLFGGEHGSIEALAAADASGNASTGGEFIPTLGIGIPGGPAMVLVMAALIIHGVTPGPGLFRSQPGALEATIGGLLISCILMAVVGYLLIRPSVYIVSLSREAVMVVALVTALVGTYTLRWNLFDVYATLGFGIVGYVLTRFGYPMAPAALGYILGGIIESSFRRGLVMSFNSPVEFLMRPYVLGLLGVGLLLFAYSMWSKRDKGADPEGAGVTESAPPSSPERSSEQ